MLYRFLSAVLLGGLAATLSAQSNVSFELNRVTYQTYNNLAIGAGDFNNDGIPDLVVGAGGSSTGAVMLMLGNGNGTFQTPREVGPVSNTVYDLAVADLNGDGNLDVVAANISGQVVVFYGNGNGTFQAPVEYSTEGSPTQVVTGDFFGDGYPDIAVNDGSSIELFRNEGGKAFVAAKTIPVGGSSQEIVTSMRAGAINGTAASDLAVLTTKAAYVLWGDGQGSFTKQQLASYVDPVGLNVGKVAQDGRDDIIVSYTCDPTPTNNPGNGPQYNACAGLDVFYGQGGDKVVKRTVVTDPGVYPTGEPMAVDVNGDGIADLVGASTGNYVSTGLYVWTGNANGSFSQKAQAFVVTSNGYGELTAGDWNRDGMMDFAMNLPGSAETEVFLNSTKRAACATSGVSPSVTACQPVNGTYTNSPVEVQANTFDTSKVTALQEYIDGSEVYQTAATSFERSFAEGLGTHLLVTKAWDQSGISFQTNRRVTVYSGTPGSVCPATPETANICLPQGTTSVSPVHIVANGSTSAVPTAAQLYIDGSLVVNRKGCDSQGGCYGGTTYVDTMQSLSSGSHDLVFKLWDANGNVYTAQKTVTVE